MGIIERTIFFTVAWIPVAALIFSITLLIAGFFSKYKGKTYKKTIIIGMICLAIPIIYYFMFFIIGMVSFGPGMAE
ncbi:hypothetical protein [Clostridium sp. BL-8]|uniref:hypothetical protein n=1 Tax=Clostridium sp. BL-8 TaxID=349938 RepID=UPI00098CED42|nr:hypothetical protein [Clostridium sp. BL-8]OOM77649.1 hypothetical protein CLOBL_29060 [Clostridium sp. BL-8]